MLFKLLGILAVGMPDTNGINGFIDRAYIDVVGLLIFGIEVF